MNLKTLFVAWHRVSRMGARTCRGGTCFLVDGLATKCSDATSRIYKWAYSEQRSGNPDVCVAILLNDPEKIVRLWVLDTGHRIVETHVVIPRGGDDGMEDVDISYRLTYTDKDLDDSTYPL